MMKKIIILIGICFLINGCSQQKLFTLKNTTQLTFEGDNGEAYFSTSNNSLVFQSKRDGNECDKLYTMDLNGDNIKPLPISDGAFTCSYYSLDDKTIFFSSTMHDGADCPEVYKHPNPHKYIWPLRNFEIYSINEDEKVINLTQNNGYDAEATIHPTEEKIIFTSLRNGDIDLYEMSYDGSDVKKITTEFGYDGGAFYSPDGNQIVWRAWYPKSEDEIKTWENNLEKSYIEAVPLDIYVANRDGSEKIRLTDNGATNWSPSWHPDGKHIVYSSNMDDWNDKYNSYGHNFELYIINIESREIQRLTNNKTFDSFPVFSKDGKSLVYASNRNADNPRQTNIFISEID